jgi:SPP1 gp7 family putative phage head morphogenesis protein
MFGNSKSLAMLGRLGTGDQAFIRNAAREASSLESKWMRRLNDFMDKLDEKVFFQLLHDGRFDETEVNFELFIVEFSIDVTVKSYESAQANRLGSKSKLAKPPEFHIPKGFRDLKDKYDYWRKKNKLTPRQKAIAKRMKKFYLKRCQSIWSKYGQEFREGRTFSPKVMRDFLRDRGEMNEGRAQTIVRTETTYYYNNARRQFYDQSKDVTHYLFVSIRDHATTAWCKTRQGLVYKKGDPLLDKETPPIHWNCRSELLPLTPANPRHRQLIEDKSLDRRNHRCEPLPKDWKGR